MQFDQVIEYFLAQVGNHTLADPRHQIEAGEGSDGEADRQQHEKPDRALEQLR